MSTTRIMLAVLFVAALTALVVGLCIAGNAEAAGPEPQTTPPAQTPDCTTCHSDRAQQWQLSRHANAFNNPAFKKMWDEGKNQKYCLVCHTTGYDANTDQYTQDGVGCSACHKPAGTNPHPGGAMTVSDSADFCGTCHTTTLHEWQKGGHGKANVACRSCHDMHSTSLRTTNADALCSNCHKERSLEIANMPMSGAAECANCHMFTLPDDKAEGKGATGHSFVMSSDACQRCHKDNIHAAHKIDVTSPPQPGVDKLITPPTLTPIAAPSSPSSSGVAGVVGGALGGMLLGFAAAVVVTRRNQ